MTEQPVLATSDNTAKDRDLDGCAMALVLVALIFGIAACLTLLYVAAQAAH